MATRFRADTEAGGQEGALVGRATREQGRCRWGLRIAAGLVLVVVGVAGLPTSGAGAAGPPFPTFTGAEYKAFYYASLPLPGTARITSRPAIYGHSGADARIQSRAEARGYRLQVTPTVALGSYGGLTLASDAGHAWLALLDASRRNGTPLQGNSGYRSVSAQREIFTRRLDDAGRARIGRPYTMGEIAAGAADGAIESVLAYHSIPGYSRHHTAKTIDLSHAGGTNGGFAGTAAHRWLTAGDYQVAKTYGFIPSYPAGAGAQGPNPEPWEYVYIGASRIRCAVQVVRLADPRAAEICGIADLPIVGDLTGDAVDDVFVYRPGPATERLYPGTRSRQLATASASPVNGSYRPVVGRFDGDGLTDILWYAPGPAADYLWRHRAGGSHTSRPIRVDGHYRPVVGDFDGNGIDDILWYAPGTAPDFLWYHRADGSHTSRPTQVNGTAYRPVAGDFDGNRVDDILWYAPGTAADFLWYHHLGGTKGSRATQVNGTAYRPVAGDFDGNRVDDILWYAPGSAADFVWYHRLGGAKGSRATWIDGTYQVATGDHDGDGYDDVAFLAPGAAADAVWFGKAPYGFTRAARSW